MSLRNSYNDFYLDIIQILRYDTCSREAWVKYCTKKNKERERERESEKVDTEKEQSVI